MGYLEEYSLIYTLGLHSKTKKKKFPSFIYLGSGNKIVI